MQTIHTDEAIGFLKLPFSFSREKLLKDLDNLEDKSWQAHFNTGNYTGNWDIICLYGPGGDSSNLYNQLNSTEPFAPTPILSRFPYLAEVIKGFHCPIVNARILRLAAGAVIQPHTDHELGYEDGTFRLHIPIITNREIEFIINNKPVVMLPGECWYTNVNLVHSVQNGGAEDRIHLVLDLQRNSWSDEVFFKLAPKEKLLARIQAEDSPETIRRTLEELRNMQNPDLAPLILDLENKLRSQVTR